MSFLLFKIIMTMNAVLAGIIISVLIYDELTKKGSKDVE